jgi:uncharacterized repeat protein (TIGR03803 family)
MKRPLLRLAFAYILALVMLFGISVKWAHAQTLTVLYSFKNTPDGAAPEAGLFRDRNGFLYGTTCCGGTADWGTVFKLESTGTESILVNFGAATEAVSPEAELTMDKQGSLYGTTFFFAGESGYGVVFRVEASGKFTLLHQFTGTPDGANPDSRLLIDKEGNLYGTTAGGGSANLGTVFKLSTSGKLTVLHSFSGADGELPMRSDLIMDNHGNLYGTTWAGGHANQGTVFKLDARGNETVLHSFAGSDGAFPLAGVVMDRHGHLYGTTSQGGSSGVGTVFELDAVGDETVLHSFGGSTDGSYPIGTLAMDRKGNLYGTTLKGGSASGGTVFEVDASGKESVLHQFTDVPDGMTPFGGLIIDKKGTLYGTTEHGGDLGFGTVFKLLP